MRVVLLSQSAQAGDAIGRQIAAKVAFFTDRGAKVRLFVESDRRLHPGLRPFTHRFAPARPYGPHWRSLTAADFIIVEYSQYFSMLDLLPLIAGGKPRMLFDYHGVTPAQLGGTNHRDTLERGRRLRGLVWYADAALVHSRFAREELSAATGYPADATLTLGYPIDREWFTPGRPEAPLRQRLGLPADARMILFVGRLAPNKRVPVLVEALARLRDIRPPVHALIVGDGGDGYEPERQRCRERAARCGVADRLHFLGHVDEHTLRDAYRDADALVIPSVHEGFCIPVIEALACGAPVVAARATALPETVADAGLTFTPDDPADLARHVRRLIAPLAPCGRGPGGEGKPSPVTPRPPLPQGARGRKRIAVVAPRFGDGFVGGAETSLRTLAASLREAGHLVEVFTTGTVEDTSSLGGLTVHRFRPDAADPDRLAAAQHTLRLPGGTADAGAEAAYLQHSPRSSRLVAALRERGPFDAIVVGPYLIGLTWDVARAFGERTLLLPCFHDEPFARLPALRSAYEQVGGILYHSPEEKQLAEAALGLNHPNAHVISTRVDVDTPGDAHHGRRTVGTGRRYLLYCGRYCREKGLPELIAFARRYAADHPERFTFTFTGQGAEPVPAESWARDLGYLPEAVRRDVTAGADALVLLSPNESLSLATLEAQAQGVPVIVRAGNAVLEGHIARGSGGVAVDGYEAFAAALDDLWIDPAHWRALGRNGQAYVRQEFDNPAAFRAGWQAALAGLDEAMTEQLRRNGQRRAAAFDRPAWREQLARAVEAVLDAPARPRIDALEIRPRTGAVVAGVQQVELVVPVRLTNRGHHAEAAEGPARTELTAQVFDVRGSTAGRATATPLPGLLLPGRDAAAVVRVAVPAEPGEYHVVLGYRRHRPDEAVSIAVSRPAPKITLTVTGAEPDPVAAPVVPAGLEPVLRAAQEAQQLPDGYTDLSEGRLARLKCWLKRKLLHNFQHAYVDVLSRQQTAFNRQVLNALAELGDGQAALAHAVNAPPSAVGGDADDLRVELRRLKRQNRRLRLRLDRLESCLPPDRPRAQETAA
jgi:glycosyltransferase involved in cell wall biosynthesis